MNECGGGCGGDPPPPSPAPPPCYSCLDPGPGQGGTPPPPPPPSYRPRGGDPERNAPTSAPAPPDVKRDDSSGDVSQAEKSPLPGWLQATGDVFDTMFGISATDAAIDRISRGEGTPDDYLQVALLGGTVHDDPFANSTKEDIAKISESLSFGNHVSDRNIAKRGWTQAMVRQAVANPKRIVRSLRDTRYNDVTQSRNNFPATAYVDGNGNYVVVRNVDNDVVQVSNRNDPNWKAPF
jgi:hypothetical protein